MGYENRSINKSVKRSLKLCLFFSGVTEGTLSSGSDDTTIRLWNMKTGQSTNVLNGHSSSVLSLAVLQDGKLASGSNDNTIRLWDMKTGQSTKVLNGHSSSILSLAVLQDGTLASGSDDNTIRLWDMKTGQSTRVLNCQSSWVESLAVLQKVHCLVAVAIAQLDCGIRRQVNQQKC